MILPRYLHLRVKNVSDKSCRENRNTHFEFNNFFFPRRKSCLLLDNVEKNIIEWGRAQMTIWRRRIACWIPKALNTHSDCVTLIALPLPQRLHKRASMLRYTCFAFLLYFYNTTRFPSTSVQVNSVTPIGKAWFFTCRFSWNSQSSAVFSVDLLQGMTPKSDNDCGKRRKTLLNSVCEVGFFTEPIFKRHANCWKRLGGHLLWRIW